MSKWLPIESAPKEELSPIYLWNGVEVTCGSAWEGGWVDWLHTWMEPQPTHWMPRPDAPGRRSFADAQPKTDAQKMSVFALTASAYEIAEFLDVLGSREKSAVIRELVNRVIPTKVIPSRGLKAVAMSEPTPKPAPVPATGEMVWCDQCDRRVAGSMGTTCKSRFCSLRKSA